MKLTSLLVVAGISLSSVAGASDEHEDSRVADPYHYERIRAALGSLASKAMSCGKPLKAPSAGGIDMKGFVVKEEGTTYSFGYEDRNGDGSVDTGDYFEVRAAYPGSPIARLELGIYDSGVVNIPGHCHDLVALNAAAEYLDTIDKLVDWCYANNV